MRTFDKSELISIERYGAEGPGPEGSIVHAVFSLNGQEFMCIDSPAKHGFGFTPSMSLFVEVESEAEIDSLFAKLSEGGKVLMPLDTYPFARKFAWCENHFGVSWQIRLRH